METVKKDRQLSPIDTWLAWVGGSFLASVLALVVSFGLLRLSRLNEDRWGFAFLVPSLVLFLGIAQALVLSIRLRRTGWWVVVTAAGCILSVLVFLLLSFLASQGYLNPMGMTTTLTLAIFGACTGVVQFLYIRPKWSQAGWWIPASLVGWALPGILVGQVFTAPLQMTLLGAIPAAVTGVLVAWWFAEKRGQAAPAQ
jgi:hypothetical protein